MKLSSMFPLTKLNSENFVAKIKYVSVEDGEESVVEKTFVEKNLK